MTATTFRLTCGHTATETLSAEDLESAKRGGYVFECSEGCNYFREAIGVVVEDLVLVVEAHICTERRSYLVTFTGPDAVAHLDAFRSTRGMTHALYVDSFASNEDLAAAADALLDPPCEHGLSSSLCAGPGHYPMDDRY